MCNLRSATVEGLVKDSVVLHDIRSVVQGERSWVVVGSLLGQFACRGLVRIIEINRGRVLLQGFGRELVCIRLLHALSRHV